MKGEQIKSPKCFVVPFRIDLMAQKNDGGHYRQADCRQRCAGGLCIGPALRLSNPSLAQTGWAASDLIGAVGSSMGVHCTARASTKMDGGNCGSVRIQYSRRDEAMDWMPNCFLTPTEQYGGD